MRYNQLKKQLAKTEDLFDSAINELRFSNMQKEQLLSILNELEVIGDWLTKQIVKNWKERYNLDTIIHNKSLLK